MSVWDNYPKPAKMGSWVVCHYDYVNGRREPYLRVRRHIDKNGEKGFSQQFYFQKDWHDGAPEGPKFPYKLQHLIAQPDDPVWITEGEKDADRLNSIGLLATTNSEGAGKFTSDLLPWFMGRARVNICADNDDAGREHAEAVAAMLRPVVGVVCIVAFPELPEHGDVSDWLDIPGNTKEALNERAHNAPRFEPKIAASAFLLPNVATIPRRAWLYKPHLVGGYVSLTLAPGGVGKSALLVTEALAMVTGKPLLGVAPAEPLKVWSMNLEDPFDELQRRVAAAAKHYGISSADIGDRLFINSGRTTPLILATSNGRTAKVDEAAVRDVIATIRTNGINVWIVDPFVASHRVPENDNNQMDMVARAYAQIAEETGAAVMLVHHTRKMGPERGTVDDGRGASALLAASRSARLLTPMTAREATDAGIEEKDRRSYVRIDHGKANMTPPAEVATWVRLQSVDLGNASQDLDRGDSVVVVTPYAYPVVTQPKVHAVELERVLNKIRAGGPWRADVRAADWVGHAIAAALLMGPAEGATRTAIKKLITEWEGVGVLIREEGKDAKGNRRDFFVAGEITSVTEVRDENA